MDENSIKIVGKLVKIGFVTGGDESKQSINALILFKDRVVEEDGYLVSEDQYADINLDEESASLLSKYLFKTVSVTIAPVLRPELTVHENHDWSEEK